MDGQATRQEQDAARSSDPLGVTLRDLPDLEPEEIEKRLAKTRQELSNRRKILIKNLPQDTTNQVGLHLHARLAAGRGFIRKLYSTAFTPTCYFESIDITIVMTND